MTLGPYLAFLAVSLLVICTPGQDTALTIRNTLAGGRSRGVATALGVAGGQAVWTAGTVAGLGVVLAASAPLFLWLRLAGAAYLMYLGVRSLLAAARAEARPVGSPATGSSQSGRAAFFQGVVSNLSNAKMAAFFVSLLPPFAGPHPHVGLLLGLGLNFCLLTMVWLTGYAYAVHRFGRWLQLHAVRRALEGVLGAVLVGLGIRVSTEALTG